MEISFSAVKPPHGSPTNRTLRASLKMKTLAHDVRRMILYDIVSVGLTRDSATCSDKKGMKSLACMSCFASKGNHEAASATIKCHVFELLVRAFTLRTDFGESMQRKLNCDLLTHFHVSGPCNLPCQQHA